MALVESTSRPSCPDAPRLGGSVSLGLHAASGPAEEIARRLVAEAVAAEQAGFEGVTVSEHHAGFPGYVPQPLLVASWLLAATTRVWSGPAPLLLGLRNPRLVAEELAWTAARYPGRLVAALAPGYAATDHEAVGVSFDDRAARFESSLHELARSVGGGGPLAGDPAVAALSGAPVPLLAAVNSTRGAERAAALGMGVLFPGREDPVRLARLGAVYREAGGRGPVVAIVSVWCSDTPSPKDDAMDRAFASAAAHGMRQRAGFRVERFVDTPVQLVERVGALSDVAGIDALNLRVHDPMASEAIALEQIQQVGADVVPGLRSLLPGGRTAAPSTATSIYPTETHPPRKGTA